MPHINFKNKVLAAFGWAADAKLSGQILNWAITLVANRLLEPADYGYFPTINSGRYPSEIRN